MGVVGLLAVIVLAAGIWWLGGWARATRDVVKATLVDTGLHAFDASGKEVWRYQVPAEGRVVLAPRIKAENVDGDGHPDVVAALTLIRPPGDGTGAVMLLDARGRLRWTQSLDDRYTFGTAEFAPGWYPDDVFVFRSGREVRVAAAWHHHTWWPSVVSLSDGNGQILGRFVNAGWIHHLALTADGRYLLAAGVSNAFSGAMLAVLDAAQHRRHVSGCGRHPASMRELPGGRAEGIHRRPVVRYRAPAGQFPDQRAGHPRRHHRTARGTASRVVCRVARDHRRVVAHTGSASAERQRHVRPGAPPDGESGAVTHPFERCPWRTPAVRLWTREGGWRVLE